MRLGLYISESVSPYTDPNSKGLYSRIGQYDIVRLIIMFY